MRKVLLLVLPLLLAGPVSSSRATTLDPSHPMWSQRGIDRARWVQALRELAADRALPQKWHQPAAARGRIAAVGRRVLVIPVLPADAGAAPITREELQARWNGAQEASVRGYWNFVSGGELDLEVRVLPWLPVPGTLANDYPNVIAGNVGNLTAGPRRMAHDALAAAARVVEDLHAFDDDGPDGIAGSGDDDAILDLVVVLHPFPGWETDPVMTDRAIVSVQARLGAEAIADTGLKADAFVVASAQGPLGVWAHEFGHLLGLPDLYDLDRNPVAGTPGGLGPQGGLGRWSLMASGTWGGSGARPSGLDAWSRATLGFGEIFEVESADVVGIPWVDADQAKSLRLHPLGDWGEEAFLVEARRPRPSDTVDADLPGPGALVYRIRPDLSNNTIAAKFIELLQADGDADLDSGANDGDAGDPFDGSAGADLLDASTTPSSESSSPSPTRTAPALHFRQRATGMEITAELSDAATLRLHNLGIADSYRGPRSWLRPGETGTLDIAFSDAGALAATGASLTVEVAPDARPLNVDPVGPIALVLVDGLLVPSVEIEVTDPVGGIEEGYALLELHLDIVGGSPRTVEAGLPIRFEDGLAPDALAGFDQVVVAAAGDTTRFARLDVADLPQPAFVGYELRTNGAAAYANGVEVELVSPWFAVPPERLAWIWARGHTEEGLPGQVFDGAAVEIQYPDRGWVPLTPEGASPVWISRRSAAATRDRLGFGANRPQWESWSLLMPRTDLPARLRVRFASDASITAGTWQVAGLQTEAYPRAQIRLDQDRSEDVIAVARLTGNFSRVNQGIYRYRLDPDDPWKPASGIFSILPSETFSIVLTKLPVDLVRAEVGLFSDTGEGTFLLGSAGFRRGVAARLPSVLYNPARGRVILQPPDLDAPMEISVYDVRGRRRARLSIPAHTTWLEWEPRSDGGALLSSGQYFLHAPGTDPAVVRFTWLR